jgi:hypothetical protein
LRCLCSMDPKYDRSFYNPQSQNPDPQPVLGRGLTRRPNHAQYRII